MKFINIKKSQHTMQQAPNHWMAMGKKVNSKSQAPHHPNNPPSFLITAMKIIYLQGTNLILWTNAISLIFHQIHSFEQKKKKERKKSYILKVLLSAINFVLKFMVLFLHFGGLHLLREKLNKNVFAENHRYSI